MWIVNLVDDIVEVYTRPSGPGDNPGYANRKDYGLTDTISLVIDGQPCGPIAVRDLIP